ncbi:hypothetical protein AMTRI_Chr10g4720 [Amborella trichopoda]
MESNWQEPVIQECEVAQHDAVPDEQEDLMRLSREEVQASRLSSYSTRERHSRSRHHNLVIHDDNNIEDAEGHNTEQGTGNTEQGGGNTEQGAGNTEHGAGNIKHGAGSTEQGEGNTDQGGGEHEGWTSLGDFGQEGTAGNIPGWHYRLHQALLRFFAP